MCMGNVNLHIKVQTLSITLQNDRMTERWTDVQKGYLVASVIETGWWEFLASFPGKICPPPPEKKSLKKG